MWEPPQPPGEAGAQTTQSLLPTQQPCLGTTLAPEVSPTGYQDPPDPHWGLPGGVASGCLTSGRRGSWGAVPCGPPGTHPVGTSLAKEALGLGAPGGPSTQSPQRSLLGTQRYHYREETATQEERRLVPGPPASKLGESQEHWGSWGWGHRPRPPGREEAAPK